MNGKQIFEALRGIDTKYVLDADPTAKKPSSRAWVKWGTLAACFCVVVAAALAIVFWQGKGTNNEPPIHIHVFGEWMTTKEATCSAYGEETRLCACGEKETQPIALLPHFAGAWVIEKEPTIKLPTPSDPSEREAGLMCQFCSHCGAKLGEELIPATGSLGLAYAVNPDGKTFMVAGIGNCTDEDVVIPENFCGYHVTTIGDGAFMNCKTVKSVTLPDTVTSIGNQAFAHCNELISIALPEGLLQIGEHAFWYCQKLESISVPQSVTDIGRSAFEGCYELKSIILPDSLKRIEDGLFASCLNLKTISLPEGLESIGASAFENCTLLQKIIIPQSVTAIGKRAFNECRSLTNVVLPDALQSIGEYLFGDCFRLESILLPQSVTRIEKSAFYQCLALTKIEIPKGVTEIGPSAFINCRNLESVVLPEGLEVIGDLAFSSCQKLSEINIPNSVRWIGRSAFDSCNTLIEWEKGVGYVGNWAVSFKGGSDEIVVREGTVGIACSAFYLANEFVRVTLPSSLKYINKYAFAYARYLETILFAGDAVAWESIEKAADWAENANQFEMIFTR